MVALFNAATNHEQFLGGGADPRAAAHPGHDRRRLTVVSCATASLVTGWRWRQAAGAFATSRRSPLATLTPTGLLAPVGITWGVTMHPLGNPWWVAAAGAADGSCRYGGAAAGGGHALAAHRPARASSQRLRLRSAAWRFRCRVYAWSARASSRGTALSHAHPAADRAVADGRAVGRERLPPWWRCSSPAWRSGWSSSTGLRLAARRPDTWEAADMAQRLLPVWAPPWLPSCATRACCCCSSAHPCCTASSPLVLRRRGAHLRLWSWRDMDCEPSPRARSRALPMPTRASRCAWSPPASARRRRPRGAARSRAMRSSPQPQAQRGARRNAVVSIEANGAHALLNKCRAIRPCRGRGHRVRVEIRKLRQRPKRPTVRRQPRLGAAADGGAVQPCRVWQFVVPAVALLLILQQQTLLGRGPARGALCEAGEHCPGATDNGWAACSHCAPWAGPAAVPHFCWIFPLHDYPRGGNLLGARWPSLACYVSRHRGALGRCWACGSATASARCRCCCGTILPIAACRRFSRRFRPLPPAAAVVALAAVSTWRRPRCGLNQLRAAAGAALPYLVHAGGAGAVFVVWLLYKNGRADLITLPSALPLRQAHVKTHSATTNFELMLARDRPGRSI